MDNKKKESKPADMHSDGVHFNKQILESKRNKSARANSSDEDTSAAIKASKDSTEGGADKEKGGTNNDKSGDTPKTSKKEIIEDMEGGYNRDAPINDKKKK